MGERKNFQEVVDQNLIQTLSRFHTNLYIKKISLCRGLHTMIVQFVILLWRGFNHVKILDWNVNISASRLYINAPKVE
jgi:hypothetical protein